MKMKKKTLKILSVLLALALICCCAMTVYMYFMDRRSAESTAEARELAGIGEVLPEPGDGSEAAGLEVPEAPEAPEAAGQQQPEEMLLRDRYASALADMDLAALREKNGDVLGWIEIPGTRISYPLVKGEDNSFYLSHNWEGGYNPAGAIFMEELSSPDFSDFNTIIYGHRMNSGDMFGELHLYGEAEYMAGHPRVYVVTDSGCRVYEVFAACEVSTDSRVYATDFDRADYREAYIRNSLEISEVESGVEPTSEDSLLTLSTCTRLSGKGYRFIVQAVYLGTVERSADGQHGMS